MSNDGLLTYTLTDSVRLVRPALVFGEKSFYKLPLQYSGRTEEGSSGNASAAGKALLPRKAAMQQCSNRSSVLTSLPNRPDASIQVHAENLR